MSGSPFIEVGLGIVFLFLLLSVLASGINEIIQFFFKARGKHLQAALELALKDNINVDWVRKIYNHPLIDTLRKSENQPPAYIPAEIFARTLVDILTSMGKTANAKSGDTVVENFSNGVESLRSSDVKTLFATFVIDVEATDINKLLTNIENWYNAYMDRISGWYKKRISKFLFFIGLVLAVVLNVDTLSVTQKLWENAALRNAVASAAFNFSKSNDTSTLKNNDSSLIKQIGRIKTSYENLESLNLPLGWHLDKKQLNNLKCTCKVTGIWGSLKHRLMFYFRVLKHILSQLHLFTFLGWLITAVAVSFGAPLWFDVLNKIINLRQSGNLPKPAAKK